MARTPLAAFFNRPCIKPKEEEVTPTAADPDTRWKDGGLGVIENRYGDT
jgi:hypothetical protein